MFDLDWRTLTRAVNKLKTPPRLLRDLIFNKRNTNETDTIDIDIVVGGQKMAPFVSDVEGGVIIQGTGRESKSIKIPRIRFKEPLEPKKLRGERGVGESFYVSGAKSVADAQNQKIMLEYLEMKKRVQRREEWMCAQALKGSLNVSQKNIEFNVDYRMPLKNKIVLGEGDRWDEVTGDPKAVIQGASDIMVNDGHAPDLIIGGTEAIKHLLKRTENDKWFDAKHLKAGSFDWKATSLYQGNYGGLDVFRYGSTFEDVSGSTSKLIDADKIYMIDTSARFSIEFGIILDLEASIIGEIFSKSWVTKDPSVLWNLIESRPLPVLWEPEAIIEIKVI
jgi:hypothetical protein